MWTPLASLAVVEPASPVASRRRHHAPSRPEASGPGRAELAAVWVAAEGVCRPSEPWDAPAPGPLACDCKQNLRPATGHRANAQKNCRVSVR